MKYVDADKIIQFTDIKSPTNIWHLCTYQVLRPWDETIGSSTYMNTPKDYLDEHTDRVTFISNSRGIVAVARPVSNGYVPFDITPAVKNWVNGDHNYGIVVIDLNEDMVGRDRHFWSSKGESKNRPYLELTYHKKKGAHS